MSAETQTGRKSSKSSQIFTADKSSETDKDTNYWFGTNPTFHKLSKLTRSDYAAQQLVALLKVFVIFSVLGPPKKYFNGVLLTAFICLSHSSDVKRSLCNGIPCANEGELMLPNSLWSNTCRCRCADDFIGPYCQYTAITSITNDSQERAELLVLIRQRLLRMSQRHREEAEAEANIDNDEATNESDTTQGLGEVNSDEGNNGDEQVTNESDTTQVPEGDAVNEVNNDFGQTMSESNTNYSDDARERARILELIRQRLLRMSQRHRAEAEAESNISNDQATTVSDRTVELGEDNSDEVNNGDDNEVDETDMISSRSITSNVFDEHETSIHKH